MIPVYPDYYNDVFGPVMQPFSSAHTAAPCRMGFLVSCLLNEEPEEIRIEMPPTSTWNNTFGLQNEDLAFLSGCTGHLPHDAILFQMRDYCKEHGIKYEFVFEPIPESDHHSAARIRMKGRSGKSVEMVNQSMGGGLVGTTTIDGYPVDVRGDTYVALVFDPERKLNPKALVEKAERVCQMVEHGCAERGDGALMYWFKSSIKPTALEELAPDLRVECLAPVTAIITRADKKPQLFTNMVEWRELAERHGKSLFDVAVEYEMNSSGWSREEVIAYMRDVIRVKMHRTTHAIYDEGFELPTSPFSEPNHKMWEEYTKKPRFCGPTIAKAIRYCYGASTGIPGVEFVPGPMGAGGGMIYATLCAVQEDFGYSDDDLLRGLFIAAGVGAICATLSEPGGGNVGCMGEMGMCAAMATAAVTEMAGGTPKQVENAAAMALMVSVGWPCDPTSGAKGSPCSIRALEVVTMALTYSEVARSGRDAVFPSMRF